METRLNHKYTAWLGDFKNAIRKNIMDREQLGDELKVEFLEFIYNYPPFVITVSDFQKRKRCKTMEYNRHHSAMFKLHFRLGVLKI